MKFAQAHALVESMCKDSAIKDSGLALQEALRDLTRLSQSTTANPLIVLDAFEACEAIANGPEGSASAEDIAWRTYVQELAREIFCPDSAGEQSE